MDQFSFEKLQKLLEHPFAVPIIVVALTVPTILLLRIIQYRRNQRWLLENPQPIPREVARMSEKVSLTAGGAVCLFMLIVTVVIAGARFIAATAIADIVNTGIGLIAGIALWGLGVNIGRRRSYVIETMHTPERAEPEV